MLQFNRMALMSGDTQDFVGIRAYRDEDKPYFTPTDERGTPQATQVFALPRGFEGFGVNARGELDDRAIRELFFSLYRTFERFAFDHHGRRRLRARHTSDQYDQDQLQRDEGGVGERISQDESGFGYFKLRSLEQTLLAVSELSFSRLVAKRGPQREIDYSKLYLYLDRGIYLDNHAVFIDQMELPRNVLIDGGHELIELYCYLLDEVLVALDEDVIDPPDAPGLITSAVERLRLEISANASHFRERHLTQLGGLFESESAEMIISTLREVFEQIDQRTLYRDRDFWVIFDAVESFLYSELDPESRSGIAWGMYGFSFVWEDLCHAWFFRGGREVLYADADLRLMGHYNKSRHDHERVGNLKVGSAPGADEYGPRESHYVYRAEHEWSVPLLLGRQRSYKKIKRIKAFHSEPAQDVRSVKHRYTVDRLLAVQTYTHPGFMAQGELFAQDEDDRYSARQLRPDMVTFELGSSPDEKRPKVEIWDYKYVGADFFARSNEKLRGDKGKSLAAEIALQPWFEIGAARNRFLIPLSEQVECPDVFARSPELAELSLSVWGLSLESAMRAYLNTRDQDHSSRASNQVSPLIKLATGGAARLTSSSFYTALVNDVIDTLEERRASLLTENVFGLTVRTQAQADLAHSHIQREIADFCGVLAGYQLPQPAQYIPYHKSIEPVVDLPLLGGGSEEEQKWCLEHLFITLGPRDASGQLVPRPSLMFTLDDRAAPCVFTYPQDGRSRLCRFTIMHYGQRASFDQAACHVIHIRPQELMDLVKSEAPKRRRG